MSRIWKLSAPLLMVLAAAFALTGGSAALRLHRSAAVSSVRLASDVPDVRVLSDRGALAPSQQVAVGVLLDDPNGGAEQALYHQLYTPGSPLYHHFLTPAQYEQRFSAPASTQDAIRQWLNGGGLRITFAAVTGYYWVARGPAADVDRLFGVQLHDYALAGQAFYANDRAPTVPGGLGIQTVFLTDMMQARVHAQGTPETAFTATPAALWQVYGAPAQDTGQGEQLGILGFLYKPDDPSLGEALRAFEADNKLPQIPLRIIPTDAAAIPSTNTGAEGEWELDTQASSGMAPGALDLDFYDGASGSLTDGAAEMAYWAQDPNGPRQASASWGQCEDNPAFQAVGLGYAKAMLGAETQAVMEGRTLFASTGDTGSGCVFPFNAVPVNLNGIVISPEPMQTMPAALPYTVAVGGTVLYPQANADGTQSRSLEYSWTHGGGGPSRFQAAPDYQQGVSNVIYPCLADDSGGTTNTGVTCRGVPDVAAMSGDITGFVPDGVVRNDYQIRDASGICTPTPPDQTCQTTTGGTSLSSPLMLGMWTRVAAAAPKPLGFADETIYAIGKDPAKYAKDFFDVTIGDNGLYQAQTGWDYTSGWGVMNIGAFAADATGNPSLDPTHVTSQVPPLPAPPGGLKPGAKAPSVPISDAACTELWDHPAGQDTYIGSQTGVGATAVDRGSFPQLDLVQGNIKLSADRKTLHFALTIANLSKSLPPYALGDVYWSLFTLDGTTYYVSAEVDPSGTVYYTYGTEASGSFSPLGTTTGSFGAGPDGVVVIDLPVSLIGKPALATKLTNTGAETWVQQGTNGDLISASNLAGLGGVVGDGQVLSPMDFSPQNSDGTFAGRTYQFGEECTPPALRLATITSTAGQPFSGTVATFTDRRASDAASDFAAVIDWGDGTSSAGTVGGANGHFTVTGSHTWSAGGDRHVSVSVRDLGDPNRPAAATGAAVQVAGISSAGSQVEGAGAPQSAQASTGPQAAPAAAPAAAPPPSRRPAQRPEARGVRRVAGAAVARAAPAAPLGPIGALAILLELAVLGLLSFRRLGSSG